MKESTVENRLSEIEWEIDELGKAIISLQNDMTEALVILHRLEAKRNENV